MEPDILYICDKRYACALSSGCAANGGPCNYTTHEEHRLHKDGTPMRFEYVPGEPSGYIKEVDENAT